jgi:hypothetical protein
LDSLKKEDLSAPLLIDETNIKLEIEKEEIIQQKDQLQQEKEELKGNFKFIENKNKDLLQELSKNDNEH